MVDYIYYSYLREYERQEFYFKYNPINFNKELYDLLVQKLYYVDIQQGLKELHSLNRRRKRLEKRIRFMLQKKCWFITLTIDNKHMKYNHNRKIKQLYKGFNYIFNVDYGDSTDRKHYHGIVQSDTKPIGWNYGFYNIKEITFGDGTAIRKYITKLSNHSLKETAEKIIYSRIKT